MIYVTDTVRFYRRDQYNIVVEQYRKLDKPTKKGEEPVEKYDWVFQGFCPTVALAVKLILDRDLLIDNKTVEALEDYYEQFRQALVTIEKKVTPVKLDIEKKPKDKEE